MDNELIKEKYRLLQNKLYLIKNKLNELENIYEDIIINTKEGFTINDKIIFEDYFNDIKNNFNNIKQETINEIIPNVNNKI